LRILLVGALSWNPERIRSLYERGHRLWGLWSRSMAWDQGPYPALEGCVRQIGLADAARTIRDERIDCVYGLLQVYDPSLWGPPARGVEHGVWTILRTLLLERERGAFDTPLVWHSGFDVQSLDLGVVQALDGHIVCNREKLAYWTAPVAEGGCGLDTLGDCEVIEFLDSDRPKLEFMNERFAERLSEADGELHTVCVGRPFGIDVTAAARQGIHVHVYANGYDDAYRTIARGLSVRDAGRDARLLRRYVHVHRSLQAVGASWAEVQRTKQRWVEEFSRYDAGWSYIGNPFGRPPLDDRAALANKVGTYLLAGLPVIADRRRGCYRYEHLRRLGVQVELVGDDYEGLRGRLAGEVRTGERRRRAIAERGGYSFDATVDSLIRTLERARASYFGRSHAERSRFGAHGRPGARSLDGGSAKRGVSARFRRSLHERVAVPWTAGRLRAALGPPA
jgi:hypothetical protein